jgi:F-type H+-transporting ATPase subunit b
MPQLDISTYSSQIFWFSICFAILYFFVGKIISPRIAEILKIRHDVITKDSKEAQDLDDKISEIDAKTNKLRHDATLKYQSTIEDAVKKSSLEKEKSLNELKVRFEEMTSKSRKEIADFLAQSQGEIDKSIEKLSTEIKQTILQKS